MKAWGDSNHNCCWTLPFSAHLFAASLLFLTDKQRLLFTISFHLILFYKVQIIKVIRPLNDLWWTLSLKTTPSYKRGAIIIDTWASFSRKSFCKLFRRSFQRNATVKNDCNCCEIFGEKLFCVLLLKRMIRHCSKYRSNH